MRYTLPYQKSLAHRAIDNAREGYEVIIRKIKKQRSLNQNGYYRGVVVKMFAQEIGQVDEETHQDLAKHFLSYTNESTGKKYVKSTRDLTTIEFENYMTQCRKLAAEQYYMTIPLPNEVTEELINQLEGWRFE